MFTSTKTILKLFSTTALIRANGILKNSKNVDELVDTASKEIHSGKKKILSIQTDITVLLAMLKAWAKGDYREVPWMTLVLSTGALIYFVNPFDAVPDMVPVLGLLDDATVIGFVVASIGKDIQNFRTRRFSQTETVEHLPSQVSNY